MVAIGVVQEQHPDRTRLYRQWRQLQWPLFVDSMNLLEMTAVPVPMTIDESGILRHARINPNSFVEGFLDQDYPKLNIDKTHNRAMQPDLDALKNEAAKRGDADAWRSLAEALFLHGGTDRLDETVSAFEQAVRLQPDDGATQFRLGVAVRKRYESSYRHPGDAQAAVDHWGAALSIDPNQYIWRRRLQQYGPRLDKPYNFYFWIEQARQEITARGETPLELVIEPMGSEIAPPRRRSDSGTLTESTNPDPEGRIRRDEIKMVRIEPVSTPSRLQPGRSVRARVTFRLDERTHPLWNNEVDNLLISIQPPEGIKLGEAKLQWDNPTGEAESREVRVLEFELEVGKEVAASTITVPAYALYYVCEDAGGVCLYLRQDFEVTFAVDPEATSL